MDSVFIVGLLSAAVRVAAPLVMGALGGLISERAGVFAVGIEGMMLAGAFGAAVATFVTGSAMAGTRNRASTAPITACPSARRGNDRGR